MLAALETELEEEKNAVVIATSEAMAMISRLQEEKSAMELVVAQLQRMAEEKAEYDEHAMALLKEILFKQEAEKHALEMEVEMYRERLLAEKVKKIENKVHETRTKPSTQFAKAIEARSLKGLYLNGQVNIDMANNKTFANPLIEGLGTGMSNF
ncbi:hypothetical protein L7F22_002390 [Adiantum nelumboides]|nr:hypothetical protein [Adiantum nelumboides]